MISLAALKLYFIINMGYTLLTMLLFHKALVHKAHKQIDFLPPEQISNMMNIVYIIMVFIGGICALCNLIQFALAPKECLWLYWKYGYEDDEIESITKQDDEEEC